jgi:biopolymer transport protein ExbB/TolQ
MSLRRLMNLTDEAPKLNPWPFIVGDAVLLGAAALIAIQTPAPLTGGALIAIVASVALGAVLACVPFLLNYTRRQDLALAERQNEIAALARTTADSAEQLGIAAQGLQTLNDHIQRALKHADQLPHKLQEKINEFKTQLNEVSVTENEVLAQEVNTLRTSEIERLETAFASVRKTAAELTALETATRQHLAEFNQSLARFSSATDHATAGAAATFERALTSTLASLETRVNALATTTSASPPANAHHPASPAKIGSAPAAPVSPPAPVNVAPGISSRPDRPATVEPPPIFERPPEVSHVTSAPPFSAEPEPVSPAAPGASTASMEEIASSPARKRPPRRSLQRDDDQPSLGLDLASPSENGEYSQLAPEDTSPPSAVSSDGFTRLLVTAYIGIGNKLFVRGEGPGLSWDKGVPLQFVSIGKWRWETADAIEPLTVKLYKNDEQECAALGEFTLAPGHQQEVRASF